MLPYDENFRKWQKSRERERERERESKTPGGVKIGIFRFIAVLSFCISTFPLWADGCNSSTSQNDCNCDGWFWEEDSEESNYGECSNCGRDKYYDSSSSSCKNCTGDYTKSKAGASRASQCYREIACAGQSDANPPENSNARLYNLTNDNDVHCIEFGGDDNHCFERAASNNSWISQNQYHLEPTSGTNQKCYSNTRNCNLFTTSGTVVPGVSGTATWSSNKWSVGGCRKANQSISGAHCTGVLVAAANNITSATANIWTNPRHFCTKCDAGYIVAGANYYHQYASSNFCESVTGTSGIPTNGFPFYICNCGDQAPSGYYTVGQQICDWSSADDDNNCKKNADYFGNYGQCCQKCGPGQTTNGVAASAADCHYTTQTRFCDAHGCFYLSGLSWDATNHTYNWGGATSTSPGQQ